MSGAEAGPGKVRPTAHAADGNATGIGGRRCLHRWLVCWPKPRRLPSPVCLGCRLLGGFAGLGAAGCDLVGRVPGGVRCLAGGGFSLACGAVCFLGLFRGLGVGRFGGAEGLRGRGS